MPFVIDIFHFNFFLLKTIHSTHYFLHNTTESKNAQVHFNCSLVIS